MLDEDSSEPRITDEILDEVMEKKLSFGWSLRKAATYLHAQYGISNERHPDRPVHPSTLMRWIREYHQRLEADEYFDKNAHRFLVAAQLDNLSELYAELREELGITSWDDAAKFTDMVHKTLKAKREVWDLDRQRMRAEVKHQTTRFDDKPVDQEEVDFIAAFEKRIIKEREERQRLGRL